MYNRVRFVIGIPLGDISDMNGNVVNLRLIIETSWRVL